MIDYANKVDWDLFKRQKEFLINLQFASDYIEDADLLEGIINLMDTFQDEFQPYDIDENEE